MESNAVWWNDYSESLANHPGLYYNYCISVFAFFPFAVIFVTFLIMLCLRKIDDYYLRRTIFTFIVALTMRTLMSVVMYLVFADTVDNNESF